MDTSDGVTVVAGHTIVSHRLNIRVQYNRSQMS